MDSVYRGWTGKREGGRVGSGGRWGADGGFFHIFEQKSSHCVFIEVHRQPQFTGQANTVADSSLMPSVALLVHPRGTTHGLSWIYRVTEMMPVKADLVILTLPLVCLDSAGVWLHVKPLFGFQFLRDCSGFLLIRSHMPLVASQVWARQALLYLVSSHHLVYHITSFS